MKDYLKKFFNSQNAIETIEFIGLVVVAAVLIAVVANIGISFADQAESAQGQMGKAFTNLDELAKKQTEG